MRRGLAALVLVLAPWAGADEPGWVGELAWRSSLIEPARLVGIGPDGEVRLVVAGRTVTRLFEGLVQARVANPDRASPGARGRCVGLHLRDHTFVVGEATIDESGARIAHALLGVRELPLAAVAAWGARLPIEFGGTPTIHTGAAPQPFAQILSLGEGRLRGVRTEGAAGSGTRSDFARSLEGVHLVVVAAPTDPAAVAVTLDLACGTRLRGVHLVFDGAHFALDTQWLGRVTIPAGAVVGFALGPAPHDEGILVICEYEGGAIQRRNLVTGEVWRREGYNFPNACFRFAPDRWLVCNSRAEELVWIDPTGRELGKIQGLSNPWSIERDRDGNLLVTSANDQRVVLFSPEGKVLHEWKTAKSALRAKPLANGNILVAMTYDEAIVELDRAGRTVWSWKCGARPVDVELLECGNYLVCLESAKKIVEVTRDGKVLWEFARTLTSPYDADRLANGNTLIADRGSGRVIEVNPAGEIVWELSGLMGPVEVERH